MASFVRLMLLLGWAEMARCSGGGKVSLKLASSSLSSIGLMGKVVPVTFHCPGTLSDS